MSEASRSFSIRLYIKPPVISAHLEKLVNEGVELPEQVSPLQCYEFLSLQMDLVHPTGNEQYEGTLGPNESLFILVLNANPHAKLYLVREAETKQFVYVPPPEGEKMAVVMFWKGPTQLTRLTQHDPRRSKKA